VPLLLIAIMTFVLISSSGTMAMAVNFGYRRDRVRRRPSPDAGTAALGATFVGMQAFEWTKLIHEGVRPWGNPWGAAQFGSTFFMITGFHGTHVTIGVIFLIIVARRCCAAISTPAAGFFTSRRGNYEIVEIMGLYWHFVDLGLGLHLRVLLSLVRSHMAQAQPSLMAHSAALGQQQHPIKLYLVVWGWLFVLSTCSYLVDYFGICRAICDGR
jgi:hypothetical protein